MKRKVTVVDDRLAALIHQELVERGHLTHFLDNLGVIQDEPGPGSALLLQQVPERLTQQAVELYTSGAESHRDLAPDNSDAQHVQTYLAQPILPTAIAASANQSIAAATQSLEVELSQHSTANSNNADTGACIAAAHAPSVLDAAVAAYKQEKRQLWKVGCSTPLINRARVVLLCMLVCQLLLLHPKLLHNNQQHQLSFVSLCIHRVKGMAHLTCLKTALMI